MNILTVYVDRADTEKVIQGIAQTGVKTLVLGMGTDGESVVDQAQNAYGIERQQNDPAWEDLSPRQRAEFAWHHG